jgi:hypothetical protein
VGRLTALERNPQEEVTFVKQNRENNANGVHGMGGAADRNLNMNKGGRRPAQA